MLAHYVLTETIRHIFNKLYEYQKIMFLKSMHAELRVRMFNSNSLTALNKF